MDIGSTTTYLTVKNVTTPIFSNLHISYPVSYQFKPKIGMRVAGTQNKNQNSYLVVV